MKTYIKVKGIKFEVVIKEKKRSYGRERFFITPKSGKGEVWVQNIIKE